jgi:DNA replication protein DnaC
MKAATEMLLKENLKALNLSHMFTSLGSLVRQARENGTSHEEFLLALTEVELQIRAENRLKRKLREAKFPLLKTLEQFDYSSAEVLDKRLMRELESGEYLLSHRNIIFTGKSGTGKTHLATGLAVAACRQGISTRFVNGCGLSMELIEAQSERRLSRVIQKYARYGLVVIDELGEVFPPDLVPLRIGGEMGADRLQCFVADAVDGQEGFVGGGGYGCGGGVAGADEDGGEAGVAQVLGQLLDT